MEPGDKSLRALGAGRHKTQSGEAKARLSFHFQPPFEAFYFLSTQGMATQGVKKICTVVGSDHFGPIPGVEVGTRRKSCGACDGEDLALSLSPFSIVWLGQQTKCFSLDVNHLFIIFLLISGCSVLDNCGTCAPCNNKNLKKKCVMRRCLALLADPRGKVSRRTFRKYDA